MSSSAGPLLGTIDPAPALVVSALAGDEVFGCGGAILRHLQAGFPVRVLVVAAGEADLLEPDTAATGALEAECRDAARLLGCDEPEFLRWPLRDISFGEPLVSRLAEAIESSGAEIVYAPAAQAWPSLARTVGRSVIEAVRRQPRELRLFQYEGAATTSPDLLLDITDLLSTKLSALRCLATRLSRGPLDQQAEALSRYRTRGLPAAVQAAEAYGVVSSRTLQERVRSGRLEVDAPPHPRMARPLVSIVLRTLGRATLETALDSIAAQTADAIEVLVVDASGQGIALPSSHRFALALCSERRPLGRAEAANLGLQAASGEHVMLLDDDDWIYPDHVATLASALADDRLGRAVYSGVEAILLDSDEARGVHVYNDPFDAIRLLYENYIPIHAMLFSRSLVDEGCRFDPGLAVLEDWDFWLQVSTRTRIRHLDRITAAYRMPGGSSVSDETSDEARRSLDAVLAKWAPSWSPEQVSKLIRSVQSGELHAIRVRQRDRERADQAWREERLSWEGERRVWNALQQEWADRKQEWADRKREWADQEQAFDAERNRIELEARTLAQSLERSESELHRVRGLLCDRSDALILREAAIAELKASQSWSITAPLRSLHRRLFGTE